MVGSLEYTLPNQRFQTGSLELLPSVSVGRVRRVEPVSLLSGMLARPCFERMWSGAKETALLHSHQGSNKMLSL